MYSFIIPCYRSASTIEAVVTSISNEMRLMNRGDFEIILVNDCSPDGGATLAKLRELAGRLPYVRAIDLAKNSGQHNAQMAGLREASGDVFISMDDDGQTRASELPKMFAAFDEGFDVVYGAYPEKKESLFRRMGSWFNKMCTVWLLGRPKELRSSSFWIMRRYVRDSIIAYDGSHAYMLGLILRATSHITQVEVDHYERESGTSGYTLRTLIGLWSNMIGFTVKPLRLAMVVGFITAFAAVVAAVCVFVNKLVNPTVDAGWSSVMVTLFFSLGVQLLFLGLIGEYVGRTYMKTNEEPQYTIRARYGFDEPEEA